MRRAAPTPRLRKFLPPGTWIDGSYRIESKLGAGAMGTVYVATDLALDRRVALELHASTQDDAQTSRMCRRGIGIFASTVSRRGSAASSTPFVLPPRRDHVLDPLPRRGG